MPATATTLAAQHAAELAVEVARTEIGITNIAEHFDAYELTPLDSPYFAGQTESVRLLTFPFNLVYLGVELIHGIFLDDQYHHFAVVSQQGTSLLEFRIADDYGIIGEVFDSGQVDAFAVALADYNLDFLPESQRFRYLRQC